MSEARSNLVESTLRNRAGQEGLFCRLQGMCCVFSFLSIITFYSVFCVYRSSVFGMLFDRHFFFLLIRAFTRLLLKHTSSCKCNPSYVLFYSAISILYYHLRVHNFLYPCFIFLLSCASFALSVINLTSKAISFFSFLYLLYSLNRARNLVRTAMTCFDINASES